MEQHPRKSDQMSSKEKMRRVTQKIDEMLANRSSAEDPLGSYTGVPVELDEQPTQDADDL